jgi:hypothetical protein
VVVSLIRECVLIDSWGACVRIFNASASMDPELAGTMLVKIYGAERGGSIPMAERILRRLPIDLRIWRDRMK